MKLSYVTPVAAYEFFLEMVQPLRTAGIDVEVNTISKDSDVVLVTILPWQSGVIEMIEASSKPVILWHWDRYSFVDFTASRWKWLFGRMSNALDIWSCTYEIGRQLKELYGFDSYIMPAWVNSDSFPTDVQQKDFIYYAASSAAFGKRLDWAKHACSLLGRDLNITSGRLIPRVEYLRTMASCRVYLMTAFEESNATIPAQEAGAMGKAVVLANLPASREVFSDTAYYFNNCDFQSLLDQLELAWEEGPKSGVSERILSNYDLPIVSKRMLVRLNELYAKL